MAKKAKQEEIPLEGKGVSIERHRDLDLLGDKFIETRDEKAKLAEQMTEIESKILDKMSEKGIEVYRFSDQEMRVKPGAKHVKIKTVKVEGQEDGETEAE